MLLLALAVVSLYVDYHFVIISSNTFFLSHFHPVPNGILKLTFLSAEFECSINVATGPSQLFLCMQTIILSWFHWLPFFSAIFAQRRMSDWSSHSYQQTSNALPISLLALASCFFVFTLSFYHYFINYLFSQPFSPSAEWQIEAHILISRIQMLY